MAERRSDHRRNKGRHTVPDLPTLSEGEIVIPSDVQQEIMRIVNEHGAFLKAEPELQELMQCHADIAEQIRSEVLRLFLMKDRPGS